MEVANRRAEVTGTTGYAVRSETALDIFGCLIANVRFKVILLSTLAEFT
jgi:hypothetical protein